MMTLVPALNRDRNSSGTLALLTGKSGERGGLTKVRGLVTALIFLAAACEQSNQDDDLAVVQSPLVTAPGCGQVPSNSVCGCRDANFTGPCFNFTNTVRFYMNLSLAPYTQYNDMITSLWIGPDAKAKFCQNPGGAGKCMLQTANYVNYNLGNGCYSGCCGKDNCPAACCFENQISTIRVDNLTDDCQNPSSNQTAIFDDINYNQGTAGDCVVLSAGDYLQPFTNPPVGAVPAYSGGGYGLNNDSVSSVKVGAPHGFITLYENYNYGGASFTTGSSIPNLGTVGFNNRASSILSSTHQ